MHRPTLSSSLTALVLIAALSFMVGAAEAAPASSLAPNVTAAVSNTTPELSDDAQAFVRVLFHLPAAASIGFDDVVILSVLWLCFCIVLLGAYRLTPFFEQGVGAWLAAFITTWLIAAAGVLFATLSWLQGIQQRLQGLTASALAAWIVILLVVIFLAYCFFLLFSLVRKKVRVDEAEREGVKLGAGA